MRSQSGRDARRQTPLSTPGNSDSYGWHRRIVADADRRQRLRRHRQGIAEVDVLVFFLLVLVAGRRVGLDDVVARRQGLTTASGDQPVGA